jgi:hypothetical protein
MEVFNFDREYKRMVDTGTFNPLIGAGHIGMLIDFHNRKTEDKKWKQFKNDLNDRNLYYYKLWKRAVEELRSGIKPRPKIVTRRNPLIKSSGKKYDYKI